MESAVQAIIDGNGEFPATSEIIRTIGFSWSYPSLDELLDRYVQEHASMLEGLKQYVASTRAESIMPTARRISEALNIRLDEVVAAIQNLGSWGPAAALSGEGTRGATMLVSDADVGAATESLEVVRQVDVDELSEQASRGELARLSANQRILAAVILIAAIFPALPPERDRPSWRTRGWLRLSRLSWSFLSVRTRCRLARKFIESAFMLPRGWASMRCSR